VPTRINSGGFSHEVKGVGRRSLAVLAVSGIVAVLLASTSALSTGCGKPPKLGTSDDKGTTAKGDPWDAAAKRLRKETDFKTCKAVLGTLNHELSTGDKAEKAQGLGKPEEDALAGVVPMQASDRDEIRSATFSPYDPAYLAECLYLRDAARSLTIAGLSPERLAEIGFAWVCRQVALDPWLVEIRPGLQISTALPPAHVLRRGSGSGLERMYVFLALLQQLGLDGCLVGPPGAAETYAPDKKKGLTGAPRGPFWAVGVRIEKDKKGDVALFDPWRGEAFPATLNQLRASPDSYKTWFESSAGTSGTTAADLKEAAIYLAVPVNSLAPRIAMLEKKLKDVDVKLAINPVELRSRFPDPQPSFWNPPDDRFAYGRAARTFLPVDQGGEADRSDPAGRALHDGYVRSQLPPAERVVPTELLRNETVIADIKERIEERVKVAYLGAYLVPPTPREQVQRGQFQDASRMLVQRQDDFSKSLLRVRNTEEAERKMREWAERATDLYRSLGSDPHARAKIDENWASQGAALVLDRAVGEVGQAEAALLLALCRHEQAERVQSRLENAASGDTTKLREAALTAWGDAAREWSGYREQFAAIHSPSPARSDHIRALAERARKLAAAR
jgi:hypothetical protein